MSRFRETLPFNLRQGVKVGLASVLGYAGALAAGSHYPYIATVSAVIVVQTYVADTLQMALYRASGTIIGCLLSIAALILTPTLGTPVCLFLAIFICAFLISYTKHFRMAAITVSIAYLVCIHDGGDWAYAIERMVEIMVGVCAAVVVSLAFFPDRASKALRQAIAAYFQEAARLLPVLMDAFVDRQQAVPPGTLDTLDREYMNCRDLMNKALTREAWFFSAYRERTIKSMNLAGAARESLHGLAQALLVPSGGEGRRGGVRLILEPELRALGEAMAAGLSDHVAFLQNPHPGADLLLALDRADARLLDLRAHDITKRLGLETLAQFYAGWQSLHNLAEAMLAFARG
ncbi:Fusaric acid resistance protein conserved region [Desulfovibrio sp. X2]|uniref:FUSC family protein n=1 Tax=Desulfovibrio sp. X2 TaxID=941449 RepID=UPI000358CA4A|nr:FUSC family protein [Desulfovibrio sp. X2]EPR37670.1 Fusaric acid resistance protein conserved region [Desulfovibrio sp. X2]